MRSRFPQISILALAGLTAGLHAQTFDRQVILQNLDAPTGITTGGIAADLYFTEIPTPGSSAPRAAPTPSR